MGVFRFVGRLIARCLVTGVVIVAKGSAVEAPAMNDHDVGDQGGGVSEVTSIGNKVCCCGCNGVIGWEVSYGTC